jgi:uncharacterized protein YbbC (DUF1343 family)
MQQVLSGIDVFLQEPTINKGSRFAIVTNNAAFTSDKVVSRLALVKSGFNLIRIFSPEHGVSVKGEDGVYQNHSTDMKTGLPIISLYGDRLMPTEEDLNDIDVVLFDIPDVGCRFYTYLWTMTYVMEACASYGKKFIVLDRPNPIGRDLAMVEGPMLDEANCSSFIGRWSIPVRHCCTLGELALYFSKEKVRGADLEIVPVTNLSRNYFSNDFYPTSPAIQNLETALLYPGMGLLEGINVNEGRGTEKPFRQFGAPWINADELQEKLFEKMIFGIKTKPCSYVPNDSLYRGEICQGLELTITDEKTFYPVAFGIRLISLLIDLYPSHIEERLYETNANPSGTGHLDKLIGVNNSFELIKSGTVIETTSLDSWLDKLKMVEELYP